MQILFLKPLHIPIEKTDKPVLCAGCSRFRRILKLFTRIFTGTAPCKEFKKSLYIYGKKIYKGIKYLKPLFHAGSRHFILPSCHVPCKDFFLAGAAEASASFFIPQGASDAPYPRFPLAGRYSLPYSRKSAYYVFCGRTGA